MESPPRPPVAGVVVTVLVLVVGAYLLLLDDDSDAPDRNETPERTESTVYPGDPSLPDPGGGSPASFPDGPLTSMPIELDDGPN